MKRVIFLLPLFLVHLQWQVKGDSTTPASYSEAVSAESVSAGSVSAGSVSSASQHKRFTYFELVPVPTIAAILNIGSAALLWCFLCKNNNADLDVCIGVMGLAVLYSLGQFYYAYLVYRSYAQLLSEMPNMLAGPGIIATLTMVAKFAKRISDGPRAGNNPLANNNP